MNANVSLDNRIWKLQRRADLTIGQNDLLHTADRYFLQDRDAESEAIITALEKELGVFNV